MRKLWILALTLVLPACAGLPVLGAFLGQQVSVAVGPELPFPDALTLDLAPAAGQGLQAADQVLGRLGGGSLKDRLGALLRQQSAPLRRQGAELLRRQLVQAQLFGSVVEQGGNVSLSLGVSRFGLAYDAADGRYHLVLDLEMQLSEPHLGVLWSGKRSAADLSAGVLARLGSLDPASLLARPQAWDELSQAALQDLIGQLVQELQRQKG